MTINTELTYYLSGPITGIDNNNKEAFTEAAYRLRNVFNLKIVNPIEFGETPGKTWKEYLTEDFLVMARDCQGIILLNGWPQSRGARAELQFALSLEWPVFFYDETVINSVRDVNNWNLMR